MNTLLHRDHDRDEDIQDDAAYRASYAKDREITLGTTMILGIFFALAVFAAVFFGFGYSMGVKHLAANAATASSPVEPGSSLAFNNFKPAPGNPVASGPREILPSAGAASPAPADAPRTGSKATPLQSSAISASAEPVGEPAVPAVKTIPRSALASSAAAPVPMPPAAPASGPAAIVQVAAVSHQEDADLLVTTLRRRGYAVAIHPEPQDHLLHVQIGPLANRAEATAMRQRLLADGFNAIVK